MIDLIDDQHQEIVYLAQGIPSEIEKVKAFTIKDYLLHLRYLQSRKSGKNSS